MQFNVIPRTFITVSTVFMDMDLSNFRNNRLTYVSFGNIDEQRLTNLFFVHVCVSRDIIRIFFPYG